MDQPPNSPLGAHRLMTVGLREELAMGLQGHPKAFDLDAEADVPEPVRNHLLAEAQACGYDGRWVRNRVLSLQAKVA